MSTYVWSDTHFNHEGILRHAARPYRSVGEMNGRLIDLWNSKVLHEGDDAYILGDFGFHAPTKHGTRDLGEIFWSLRGKKHLVVGNHDEKNQQTMRLPWESVTWLRQVKIAGRRAILCHYPLETWAGSWRGVIMLHGHCHGTLKRKLPKRFDVGVDALGVGGPLEWDELHERADKEQFTPVDGHGDRDM